MSRARHSQTSLTRCARLSWKHQEIHPTVTLSRRVLALVLLSFSVFATGCRKAAPVVPGAQKSFPVKGRIVATDPATGQITLDHEAIPGYMEAMTMPYKLAQPDTIGEFHPGDRIIARLVLDATRGDDPSGYRRPRLEQLVITSQARPDYKPAVDYHVPTAGDAVPDFALLNQSGKTIHLSQFKGKVVAITFIYTRCPLADYCPRMSRNFAELDQALAADPVLYKGSHLLSISFDPTYDTPAVLRSYGGAYTGKYTKEQFQHWDFAAPPVKELQAITTFFNVGITPGDTPVTLQHSLSTLIIGKDGKVASWYPTNDWKSEALLKEIKAQAELPIS
jgi:protein SCO1/2